MIFDEIPFELKELIFTHFTPDDWINTAKVSNEWLNLTLGSIKKVESCHVLILDHLAEFINQQRHTNYNWLSLLALMPKLEHLQCFENTEAFWTGISLICHQLKILDCNFREVESFDCNKLDISFANLVELSWDGSYEGAAFLLGIFELAPNLEKITLKRIKINAEWKNKIPKSVKHILLKDVQFVDEHQCSIYNLCEDTSTLETFCAFYEPSHAIQSLNSRAVSHFFDGKSLKKLELSHPKASGVLQNALTRCPNLETVCIDRDQIRVTVSWHKRVPTSVKSFKAWGMSVADNVRRDFSFHWLFQNYGALQSLEVQCGNWTGVDPEKFRASKNLKKLYLDSYVSYDDDDDPFSGICFRMIGGSRLVHVEVRWMRIDESWRQIFPPTVKRLKLVSFLLSNEAKEVFSPQFICENPSNIEFLSLQYFGGALPAMDLNAFNGMSKLEELHLISLGVSGECLQSILTHCSALGNLFVRAFTAGAWTNIPCKLVLPSLRKLHVKEVLDQPSLLFQHFPKMGKVDITIVPTKACWLEVMDCLQGVETAKINVRDPSCDVLCSSIENIDDTEFKYYYLTVKYAENGEFFFYLTNSLLDACTDLHRLNSAVCVLWIKNFPTSPLLRERMPNIPSSLDDLLQRYHDIMAQVDDSDDGIDDGENDE